MDPRAPDYEVTIYHLRTIKRLLSQAADRYREKYELSTNRIDDFKLAINFLGALRRIHVLLSERDEAETVKKNTIFGLRNWKRIKKERRKLHPKKV